MNTALHLDMEVHKCGACEHLFIIQPSHSPLHVLPVVHVAAEVRLTSLGGDNLHPACPRAARARRVRHTRVTAKVSGWVGATGSSALLDRALIPLRFRLQFVRMRAHAFLYGASIPTTVPTFVNARAYVFVCM